MQTVHGIETFSSLSQEPIILALGNFDGVHLGHQKIITTTVNLARKQQRKSAVLIFLPHPLAVLCPESSPNLLITVEDRIRMLNEAGIDYVILHPFTKDFALITPEYFVRRILVEQLQVAGVVVGYNYSFGHRGCGNSTDLQRYGQEYGFLVKVVPPVTVDGESVGSSFIRKLLAAGKVEKANKMLGYTFFLRGKVIHGDGRGHKLGFPTANLKLAPEIMCPASGVYLTQAIISGQNYWSLTNIGRRPTFHKSEISIEVHLLDTKKNLYAEELVVRFLHRMREEKSFADAAFLIAQINEDIQAAKNIISRKYT
ncbi:MAG: bifunctional riboflavin kinase/FAD synthetase [Firmicutes bacterium]|nr:bifunctional riboflavin kinase/FAD synthetase [Bacillota bacterium]